MSEKNLPHREFGVLYDRAERAETLRLGWFKSGREAYTLLFQLREEATENPHINNPRMISREVGAWTEVGDGLD